jgi:hypothetical protein
MGRYRVFIERDFKSFALAGLVRLHILNANDPSHTVYLRRDGSWEEAVEGAMMDDSGLVLPAECVEPLAVAIQEFQGHTSHADTEAKVLREWLAVEQARVNKVLGQ